MNLIDPLPYLTEDNYHMRMCPPEVIKIINKCYNKQKEKEVIIEDYIPTDNPPKLYSFKKYKHQSNKILRLIKPYVEQWCGKKLIPHSILGVREYGFNSHLSIHKDSFNQSHISCTIFLGSDGVDWGFELENQNKEILQFLLKPNGMLFYESFKCNHGRSFPYKGEYHRNLFLYYLVKDWIH